ncbi:lanthionine synthetase C-like family protein [Mycobacterium kansasii]|uniref:Lanthionine synthetase C-like family protein n=1 Tax=Mycobacterium kansasii TaxID=1768 RepID=A0A1V3XS62_MYCKA|nr:lanthionine synthetase C-like family protein [Mycobacterium kansasii]
MRQPRIGSAGRRSWSGQGSGSLDLNGISHGAAGYAYALASLAEATGIDEFADAAAECIAFENANFDPHRHAWADLDSNGEKVWPCKWCHGSPGIGLARIAMAGLRRTDTALLYNDVTHALTAVENSWAGIRRDTLCCGTLGSVEFLSEAGTVLGRDELRDLAARHLAGSSRPPPLAAITDGAAVPDGSTPECSRAWPVSATRSCAGSMTRFPTSWCGNSRSAPTGTRGVNGVGGLILCRGCTGW